MTWTKLSRYRWDRDDKKATISASRHGSAIWYSVWLPDPEAKWHPTGWRCVDVVDRPQKARAIADGQSIGRID